MALHALTVPGFLECQSHFDRQFFSFRLIDIDIAVFGSHVLGPGTVAVFAPHVVHVRCLRQPQITGRVGEMPLWIPAHDMAAYTLRIKVARDIDAFAGMYPELEQFKAIKRGLDPQGKLSSSLARRLGITEDR